MLLQAIHVPLAFSISLHKHPPRALHIIHSNDITIVNTNKVYLIVLNAFNAFNALVSIMNNYNIKSKTRFTRTSTIMEN